MSLHPLQQRGWDFSRNGTIPSISIRADYRTNAAHPDTVEDLSRVYRNELVLRRESI